MSNFREQTMNTIEQSAALLLQGELIAQGDVYLEATDEEVSGAEQKPEDGKLVLAHSETGHHHALAYSDDVTVWDVDDFTSYVENRSDNVIELKHHRSFDTHAPIGIPPGKYKITRQREYTPEGYRRAAD